MKQITIVVCTYNRNKYLKLCLQSLVEQTLSQNFFDVIVIDNNSTDNTKKIANFFSDKLPIKYVFEKNQGLSYARNRGIKESNTKYIAYIDDDAQANKNLLKIAYKIIIDRSPNIFGGPIYPYYELKKPKWLKDKYEIRLPADETGYLGNNQFLSGSNLIIKKNILSKLKGFKINMGMKGNKLGYGEETDLIMKYRKKFSESIYYDNQLIVRHLVPEKKMKISYFIKSFFISGITYKIIEISNKNKRTRSKEWLNIIKKIFGLLLNFFKLPFRDRLRYPYWQNYFIEKVLYTKQ